ncbi:MAG: hypothetical protein ACKOE9_03950, partial [Vulcanococcus sp.]
SRPKPARADRSAGECDGPGTWLGLGAGGGRLLVLNTATVAVLGHGRQQRAILRWTVSAPA